MLVCKELEDQGFPNGFSTRLGGVSDYPENSLNLAGFGEDSDENIAENRKRFLSLFDEGFSLTSVWQVHGNEVKVIRNDKDILSTYGEFDAMISELPRVLLGVKTADCVPVLIGDPKTKSFGAVHAGWRGTVKSIVVKAIERMSREFGSEAEDLVCAIGPAAGRKRYEIGQEVIDAFQAEFPTSGKLFKETRKGHALIDLHLANEDQLIGAGVRENNIYTAPFCTMDRNDLFFSYRLEKKKYGKTGRLLSVIGRKG